MIVYVTYFGKQEGSVNLAGPTDRVWEKITPAGDETYTWGADQVQDGGRVPRQERTTFANSLAGEGWERLTEKFSRQQMITLGGYLCQKRVMWPVTDGAQLVVNILGEVLTFSESSERRALYFLAQACEMMADGDANLGYNPNAFIKLISESEGFSSPDSTCEMVPWTSARIRKPKISETQKP